MELTMRKLLIYIPVFIFFGCSQKNSNRSSRLSSVEKRAPAVSAEQYAVPDTASLANDDWARAVKYGLLLVKNTAHYIGPEGTVSKNLKNKMNCTNCHLENGTRPFGLNFFDSHRTYPQYRAREDKILTMEQRVNNCIERPHSGKPLPLNSKEMVAIVSYIKWIGESYHPQRHVGYGLKTIDYKGLTADPLRGAAVYSTHCESCHQKNGEGKMNLENTTYIYPPLWGEHSYQETSSMHRVIKAASFIKYNMPNLTTSHDNPTLSDQEALDVAAFINDGRIHKRPKTPYSSYQNTETKPIDFFQGPYTDPFSEEQHTFGPWDQIEEYYLSKGLRIHK
ncbi:cytochrome C class I [Sphingobacteriaceae bacterium]|nr:cytochrome C class I [Sphingobacteriaceae bacterium]